MVKNYIFYGHVAFFKGFKGRASTIYSNLLRQTWPFSKALKGKLQLIIQSCSDKAKLDFQLLLPTS